MNHKILTNIIFAILLGLVLPITSFACQCEIPSVCLAYSRAKKVFIGKLEKIVETQNDHKNLIVAYFRVEKTFKGKRTNQENVTFKISECDLIKFQVGEKYFVYVDDSGINTYCNRTGNLADAKNELDYVNNLSIKHPIFTISGYIPKTDTASDSFEKGIKLIIRHGKKKTDVLIDKNGLFSFTARKKGIYEVAIQAPFDSNVTVRNDISYFGENVIKVTNSLNKTLVKYRLEFKPNECDFKEFHFIKSQ